MKLKSYDYPHEIKDMCLKDFPVIDSFAVVTEYRGKDFGHHLYFINKETNRKLTSFPWWDFAEKSIENMTITDIPIGKISDPFMDLEQGWQIIIFEKRDFVFILQGNEPCCTEFRTWYCVAKEVYITAWKEVLT